MKRLGKTTKTHLGFELVEFTASGHKCSLQESSIATERTLWLGPDSAAPKVMASKAASVGVKTDETCGWVPYPIPDEVLLNTRMHLNRRQVKALVRHLQSWLERGTFKVP